MVPDLPGTYVVILRLTQTRTISVGKLGPLRFPTGWYAYAGSARGPGGLRARVSRHLGASRTTHWHIDYLTAYTQPALVWYAVGDDRQECRWAEALLACDGVTAPAIGFGASDCVCESHLVWCARPFRLDTFADMVAGPVSVHELRP